MTLIKRLFKWTGWTLLALMAVGLIGYLTNKTYMDRYFRMAVSQARGQSQQAEWYDPVDKVPGAVGPALLGAAPEQLSIDPAALKAARDYAKSKDSYGLEPPSSTCG